MMLERMILLRLIGSVNSARPICVLVVIELQSVDDLDVVVFQPWTVSAGWGCNSFLLSLHRIVKLLIAHC